MSYPAQIPCLVHCKIVFSILKTLAVWYVFTWTVQMRLWSVLPERMGNTAENSAFFFIPKHCIRSVPINTSCLESGNIRLVIHMCYSEIKCHVSKQ